MAPALTPPVPRDEGADVPHRPRARVLGGLSLGLLLGAAGGWLAGLLQAPKQVRR